MTAPYLAAIKAALAKGDKSAAKTNTATSKHTYWKPVLGEHEIRFLPVSSTTGEPFQEVLFYDKKELADNRFVAPYCLGLPDPIKDQFEALRKTKEGWAIAKHLRPKERYYAVILVRGEEAKGPQIWEFSKEIRDQIYGILSHKDNIDEDMFSTEVGYDFTCAVTQVMENGKPRMFKGFPVKQINLQNRRKPSPLSKDKAQSKAWIDAVPDLQDMFKKMCKSPEDLVELLESFVTRLANGPSPEDGTDHMESKTGRSSASQAEDKLSDAFSDMF